MGLKQTFGLKFRKNSIFMTKTELDLMESMIEAGELTFFHTKLCDQCRTKYVLKDRQFCSVQCFDESLNAEERKRMEMEAKDDETWSMD